MTLSPISPASIPAGSVFAPPQVEGCSQIYAECRDPNCQRPCGARPITPVYDLTENTRPLDRWDLAFIAFAVVSLLVVFLAPVAVDRFDAVQIATSEDVQ